ncbi:MULTISPECIES: VC0807 family protein [Paraburkholderia]|uniref:VC0807 family protein n=1 Tax=Paraburkholderia TaxID=1822464 RepID=UPI002257CE5F|nr:MULTISPECIES: VC0807 family protein [Paraburkholderia]MCX4166052.1 hypothetical protein [Paraburkholderia megapolitana]MDN7161542.1 hypothetical protein [Paraburkholderia sp. CHISQ3]MDQ6498590.1 hypothetical protein [Paraburkholderia megapolitana]
MKIRAGLVVELVCNLLLPWVAYRAALPVWGPVGALYASAVPPIVWSVIQFARSRRVDALSALVLLGIVLSLLMMALGGSPRLLLIRESLVTGAIGAVFLLSLMFTKPAIFYLARATVARERENGDADFEAGWHKWPKMRASIRLMTWIWGIGLVGECALRCWLVWQWSVERYLVVSPVIGYGIFGGLTLWTMWYARQMRQRARLAAAGEAPSAN